MVIRNSQFFTRFFFHLCIKAPKPHETPNNQYTFGNHLTICHQLHKYLYWQFLSNECQQAYEFFDTISSNFPKVINQPRNLARHHAKFQPNYLLCYSARQSSLFSYQMDRASTGFTWICKKSKDYLFLNFWNSPVWCYWSQWYSGHEVCKLCSWARFNPRHLH